MPQTPFLDLEYPTPLDPAYADIWGDICNDIFLSYDSRSVTYDWGIRKGGVVSVTTPNVMIWGAIPQPRRLYSMYATVGAGSCVVTIKKNGTAIGGLTAVSVNATPTEHIVDSGGNPYIDFVVNDTMTFEVSSVAGATDLQIWMQVLDDNP